MFAIVGILLIGAVVLWGGWVGLREAGARR
jgi:hypothetical protein